MCMVLYFDQIALLFQIFYDCFSCCITFHTSIFAACFGHGSVIVHYFQNWQVVTTSNFIVVRVMCRSDLNNTGTKFHINIIIANNRNLTVNQWKSDGFADQVLVTFILWIYCNCGIAQHGFWTGSSKDHISAAIGQWIAQMPEVTCLLGVFNFRIRKSRYTMRTPVYNS